MDDVSSGESDTASISSLQVSVPDSHRPRWSYLPDLRLEQFFLATVRHMVTVSGSSMDAKDPSDPRVYPEVSETAPVEGRTRWKDVQSVAWVPLLYALLQEQVLSPLWQGVLWGIGGVTLAYTRNALAIARAGRIRSAAGRAAMLTREAEASQPDRGLISGWIARLGLTRLFI